MGSELPIHPAILGLMLAETSDLRNVTLEIKMDFDNREFYKPFLHPGSSIIRASFNDNKYRFDQKNTPLNKTYYRTELLKMGLAEISASKRFIPLLYMKADKSAKELFLQGYFNGVPKDVEVSSCQMATDLESMLLELGFDTKVVIKPSKIIQLDNEGRSINTFPKYKIVINSGDV